MKNLRKKSIILVIALVVLAVLLVSGCRANYDPESDFETQAIEGSKGVEITGYLGSNWDVRIPRRIQKRPVTIIGDQAFHDKSLISVTIPRTVTTIGHGAFSSNQLTSVSIPNSVTTIGAGSFARNPDLTAINVSSGNPNFSSISGVLYNKTGTILIQWPAGRSGTVTIPNRVAHIGGGAFNGNRLTSVTIPNSVTSIGDGAFVSNQLTSVTIPDSVTTIGDGAFAHNQLTSVTIPNSVTSIGEFTFYDNQLTSVTIPYSVTSIGEYAFAHNQLTSVTIPGSVTSIGVWAFSGNQLTSVTIPNSVTSIGGYAFSNNQLTSVTIPNSVTNIGSASFGSNITTVVGNQVVFVGSRLTTVTIGAGVTLSTGTISSTDILPSIGSGFESAYNNSGRLAGTYTRPNTTSTIWTRR